MSLFGILVIIAILTAVPTFGLSFVALYFAKKWINQNEGKQVTAAALNALNRDETVTIPFVSSAGIQSFFKSHGTTDKKFDRVGNPTMGYIGYVKIHDAKEFVLMVNGESDMVHVTSFVPPQKFGNDLISLVAKNEFINSIINIMQEGRETTSLGVSRRTRSSAKSTDQSKQQISTDDRLAFERCLRSAEQGNDHDPMFEVAEMYRFGNGTKKNLEEAFKWYMAAVDWAGGHPEAKNRIGLMYRDGQGVTQDFELARDWFLGASTNANYDAMFNLGIMVASGQGGTVDYNEAMSWILPAADSGHEVALEYVELLKKHNQSEEVPHDPHAAFDWHVRAAERAHEKVRQQMGL